MVSIHITGLKKNYGEQTALHIDSLQIAPGSLTGIVGNNGAGKTTMFRLLLDLIRPEQGLAEIEGKAVKGSDHWKTFTGSYLDEGFLIGFLSPVEYFHFAARLHGISEKETEERLEAYAGFLGDEAGGSSKTIRQLSSGNKQKVGIVAALMIRPALLVLDEPFNYLDPSSQIMIRQMLQQINHNKGTTMLVSSHNLNYLTDICDRIVLLEKGKIVKDLTPPGDDLGEVEAYFRLQAGKPLP